MSVVTEKQISDTAWYANPIPNGSAKDNYDRIIQLRKTFCHPLTIHPDGRLNTKYFSTQTKQTAMNWSDIELLQLYSGIYKHGIHSIKQWRAIKCEFLMQRDFIEILLKLNQLFGIQDLGKYEGVKFENEKQIRDEFEKNKAAALESGCWNEKCGVAFKAELVALSKADMRALAKKELEEWKTNVYDNPQYIYRITNKDKAKSVGKGKGGKKKKNAKKKKEVKEQKNTIDAMLKKQTDEKKQNKNDKMEMDADEDGDEDVEMNKEKESKAKAVPEKKKKVAKGKKKAKAKKKPAKAKKDVPQMPEDSEDEDMLCVE